MLLDLEAQRMRSLGLANERRVAAADAKREIRQLGAVNGLRYVATLLDDRDERIEIMSVRQLVRSVHRMGDQKVAGFIEAAGIATQDRRVDQLTDRQRGALAEALRDRAASYREKVAA